MRRRPILEVLRARGFSAEEAGRLVGGHRVLVEGRPVLNATTLVRTDAEVRVLPRAVWRPRGFEKLSTALVAFGIDLTNARCLDLGSSTGGFVMALLEHGAAHVVAVERGRNQLDVTLRNDARVESHEGVDVRRFAWPYPEPPDAVTADLSWVSLCEIMGDLVRLGAGAREIVVLIKPQFEVDPASREHGVVRDPSKQQEAVARVCACASSAGALVRGVRPSEVRGARGNQEYFLWMSVAQGGVTAKGSEGLSE